MGFHAYDPHAETVSQPQEPTLDDDPALPLTYLELEYNIIYVP